MALIVQKFGGTSVANAERVFNVAQIITETYQAGNSVVAVVSAQGDTTDDLIEKANEINPAGSKREMDVLLSTGEQISMALVALAIQKLGFPVVSLTGPQAGMHTDNTYGNARISRIDTERIQAELGKGKIVIVAGFQGINRYDDITTLGRGGSDTTAVAFAAALNADLCQIYTDVDGIYTADPRIVKDAHKLDEISYDEMLELASLGAQVLHNRSVEMAKRYHVDLEVLSSFQKIKGTKVKEVVQVEKMLIRGVARDNDVARISIIGLPDQPGTAYHLFSLLAKAKINVDVILQSIGRDGTKDVSFTVGKGSLDEALSLLHEHLASIGGCCLTHDSDISKVSIVGAGMTTHAGVAATMFEALYEAGINIQMISTSEIKVSVLIAREDAERAVKVVHNAFHFGD
ncbi:aspartate kinase [Ethanoligenens harbinense]|uniref:Aspartokinase n=1 Tax=Ethanoligenens harbinense (strain DSM 18485 / JCM 12961 / CGMCC 1.5033 / YUAN-3) TaxID=663278 RepID=E6U8D8_ETHHY|nr:aspartate kinase [Ethanoligenens harbinense]ADU28257.1 aspartate kinase [Ethanoligenens harbinense YUAN-3]AVQ97253.1 aspartate kinase [Ethanoligenens harbinense YUAN-3]AYF39918.1 aspartate kinase [Ethanoligenens harbinense]AYF42748.1 aspartate kinase [Ethanoligenens harbinense]QCN93498.1 aspartate kinase [Ethanoligenens harbinense]